MTKKMTETMSDILVTNCRGCDVKITGGKGDYWHINENGDYGNMAGSDGHLAYPLTTEDRKAESPLVSADPVREYILAAIYGRANREQLWDMPLKEIDLETMADEIVELLDESPKGKGQ